MFHVRAMSAADSGFAVRLTDQMNWDLTRADFELMMELEPAGCFVLLSDSKRIGVATTARFGKAAWFGNFIVDEAYRGKGAGSLLIRHALAYLNSKHVETVGLFSYMHTTSFYENIGFKRDSDFVVLRGNATAYETKGSVEQAGESDVPAVADFDRRCFPGDRERLLRALILNPRNRCLISVEDRQMLGYLVAKVYDGTAELGPLVCREGHNQTAVDLIQTCLTNLEDAAVSLCIAKKHKAVVAYLEESGFREDFCVARMFRGRTPPVSECMYGAESLERG